MTSQPQPTFDPVVPAAVRGGATERVPVAVVGAGPVGLSAAIDLALQGVPVVLLDEDVTVSTGSRAICWAKRTLEIFDRLGVAAPMMEKGVTWQKGRIFARDKEIYAFDLLPEPDHAFPAFINLQQYYVEQALIDRARSLDNLELRWANRVVGIDVDDGGATLDVETREGPYRLAARHVIAADGARSTVRRLMNLEFVGRVFEDRFLIADVRMKADFPTERWFWFLPPFHAGPSALLHRQADDVWRIDLQLGPDVDPEQEAREENVRPRLEAMLGPDVAFDLEWVSVYTFQARRLRRLVHGPVAFVGDSAHQVSPFGARGGNSGVCDAENLVWKLRLVLDGKAPPALLGTYDDERTYAAIENLTVTSRTTDFMSAKGPAATAFRDAALTLAEEHPFARRFVNGGRLSTPTWHRDSPLNTRDRDRFASAMAPGTACTDAPVRRGRRRGWLLERLGGDFRLLYRPRRRTGLSRRERDALESLAAGPLGVVPLVVADKSEKPFETVADVGGRIAERYDLAPGTAYLIRPDQHVAARWRSLDPDAVGRALGRATARTGPARRRQTG